MEIIVLDLSTLEVTTTRCTLSITRDDMPHHHLSATDLDMSNVFFYKTLKDSKIRVYKFRKANYEVIKCRLAAKGWSNKLNVGGLLTTRYLAFYVRIVVILCGFLSL